MELSFQSVPLNYLRCVMREVHFQEETADTIVPDSYPDIARIADCYADVILRGKDCRERQVSIAGGIKGGILYIPEDESEPRNLEFYIPFSMKFEHSELSERAQIVSALRVRSVDAEMINSRKAMLRVRIGCELAAYERSQEEICELKNEYDDVQTKYNSYHLVLPLESVEKSFVIQDTIDFSGHPALDQIYKFRCELLQADQKIVGNKVIFKGSLICKLLYRTKEQRYHLLQNIFSYSQYCELSEEYDEETVEITPVITGYDFEQEEGGGVFHVHILAQCLVSGDKRIQLLDDAFALKNKLEFQRREYEFPIQLDQQCSKLTIRKQMNRDGMDVIDTDVYWDFPIVKQDGDVVRVTQPVVISVLTGTEQTVENKVSSADVTSETVLAAPNTCHATSMPTGELYTSITGDLMEVRCGVQLCSSFYASQNLQGIFAGEITEENIKYEKSMVVVRKVPANTMIWDLAKAYRTREKDIIDANDLDSDCVAADTILLLPIL